MSSTPSPTPAVSGLLVLAGVVAFVSLGLAASPAFWRVSTQEEFLQGEVENVSIDATGQILIGPDTDLVYETTAPFLWSVVEDDGALWVGSGNDGKVFLVPSDGTGREVFDADELNVHALTPDGDGGVYAGTSPDGAVYRVTRAGTAEVVFDPEEPYIWAVARRAATQTTDEDVLFVATGDPGRIYRVDAEGNATLFYDTKATHTLTLAFDGDGNLLAGTGAPGQVVRISPEGQGFVVLNSPFDEVRSLRRGADGSFYAVAVSQGAGVQASSPAASRGAPTATTVSTSATVTVSVSASTAAPAAPASTSSSATSSGSTSGAVYRIRRDGVWDTVWESSVDAPYDVTVGVSDGMGRTGILIGTGRDGKIFHVFEDPKRVVLLTRAAAQQVTRFAAAADGSRYYVTANPGKVHRLSARRATSGTYVSDVRDAETFAAWGTVRWRATTPSGTSVRLFTRSGNTNTPNDMWSAWSEAYTDSTGSQIVSPGARYIQWKAELRGTAQTPALLSVTTAYLPRNLRPALTSVTVHDPGVVFQQPFSGTDPPIAGLGDGAEARAAATSATNDDGQQQSTLGRRVFRKGLQTFVWAATDPNDDDLRFDVLYRPDAADGWTRLATALRASIYTWDTTSVPDGTYVVRIVASDGPSNAPGAALTGYAETGPFDVDNSPPQIDLEPMRSETGRTIVPFSVTDSHSPVHRVEYSFDTEEWQIVYPVDGIPDSLTERFEVAIPGDNEDGLIIRATDALGNTVTAQGR